MNLWPVRIFFLLLCTVGGYAVSQVHPTLVESGRQGTFIGLGLGAVLIAIDEMLKGFSLRAFSAATFGLALGALIAWLTDQSRLFEFADERQRWMIRLGLFLAFGYIGIILAMRSNKEDLALIIPYVRFTRDNKPDDLLVLDTSAIIDGRITALVESRCLQGVLIIPRFVLLELQQVADSADSSRRQRGRRGLEMLQRLQQNPLIEVRLNDTDYPEEKGVDGKLLRLAQALGAKLFTSDFNLSQVAEIQRLPCVNIAQLALALKPVVLPGDTLSLKMSREGKERGQAVGYLPDGAMVVVNQAQAFIGQTVMVEVVSVHQTGAGVIFFAELKPSEAQRQPKAA
ncbi:MAG: twitching motility protein PilT [Verrucomicrobia bacterium]|nr:twitching motility protein PilT [Verrucomicrobiota bacterium]MBI3870945.1 twitching motility protein PilT [Verrucomicrobiota bacterium]